MEVLVPHLCALLPLVIQGNFGLLVCNATHFAPTPLSLCHTFIYLICGSVMSREPYKSLDRLYVRSFVCHKF